MVSTYKFKKKNPYNHQKNHLFFIESLYIKKNNRGSVLNRGVFSKS